MCACASMRPGVAARPSRSMRRVPRVASASISRSVPRATMRPCAMARASTVVSVESTVWIRPWYRTKSGEEDPLRGRSPGGALHAAVVARSAPRLSSVRGVTRVTARLPDWLTCAGRLCKGGIQSLQILGRERHGKRCGIFLDVLRRARLRNCDDVTSADDPGQRDRGGGAAMRRAKLSQRMVTHHEIMVSAQRGIRHHRHVVLLAPWQELMLDATVVETVRNLIGGAVTTVWNTEQILHLAHVEVGDAPCADFSRRAQLFECGHHTGELRARDRPMQQIEIEIVRAEAPEARCAGPRDAISGDLVALDLGDQEYALAGTGEHVTDELFGTTAPIVSGSVDQRHPEREAGTQRVFLDTFRMPSLPEMPAALTERGHCRAVRKTHGTPRGVRCRTGGSNSGATD